MICLVDWKILNFILCILLFLHFPLFSIKFTQLNAKLHFLRGNSPGLINAHIDSCSDFLEFVIIHNVIFGIPNINTQTDFVTIMCSIEIAIKLNIFELLQKKQSNYKYFYINNYKLVSYRENIMYLKFRSFIKWNVDMSDNRLASTFEFWASNFVTPLLLAKFCNCTPLL